MRKWVGKLRFALRKKLRWNQKPLTLQYNEVIERFLNFQEPSLVLDAGCGAETYATLRGKVKAVVGVDREAPAGESIGIDARVTGDLRQLPFGSNIFDMILSYFVVEHLDDPATCFREFNRVCKPDGVIVIVTPNLWHYGNRIAALTPHSFHKWFARKIAHSTYDHFPTVYKVNTPKKLVAEMRKAGFIIAEMRLLDLDEGYLGWLTTAGYAAGLIYHWWVNRFDSFSAFRGIILAQLPQGC